MDSVTYLRLATRYARHSSLINSMDDVEDNSELRRGEPVAHTIYGVPQTINTANYVYFQAIQELLKLQHDSSDKKSDDCEEERRKGKGKGKEDLIGLVTEELLNLHRGQGLDLFWRDSLVCPTEEEYVHMVLGSKSSPRITLYHRSYISARNTGFGWG